MSRFFMLAGALLFGLALRAAEVDVSRLPPPATNTISFAEHIRPIIEKSCIRCHGPEKPKGRFRLDHRDPALRGGAEGVAIVPGNSAQSPLIHYVAGLVEDMEMPPAGKGDPLTPEQIGLLRAWIDQGVKWDESQGASASSMSVSPLFQWIGVSGNRSVFREHQWRREGITAGVEHFDIRQEIDERTRAIVTGRALRDDYRVSLTIERDDVGFIAAGAEEFHKFSSDAGGFSPALSPSVFSLNRDLRLDIGRAWVDFGLTLPDLPRVVVGYEYQFRQGEKSTLQWGGVVGPVTNNIFPAAKRINEDVHIIKFDVSHTIAGVLIEDSFRGEFYDLATSRQNAALVTPGVSTNFQRIDEGQSYFRGANTFRLEKQFNDWLFGSGGYLYAKLDSDADFRQNSDIPPTTIQSLSDRIILSRESHVANLNALLGPWHGLSLAVGVQADWMSQHGFGIAREQFVFFGFPADADEGFQSNIERVTVEESVRLRYTGLPFTVLFAEARLEQESTDHYESATNTLALREFLRDTDASSDLRDWRVGFSASPWSRSTFNAHFRQHQKFSRYDHLLDIVPPLSAPTPNDGYSAFIRSRDVCSDEVEARWSFRPARWLKTTLGYRYVMADYWTETDATLDPAASPGGWVFAGEYSADIYSVGVVLTPIRRLYWSTTFAFHDTSTETHNNGNPAVVPYRGHIYNVISSASYALSARMDLHGSYTFSAADYSQNNSPAGLPVGLEFRRHGVQAGITRRWLKNVSTRLQYAFYKYDEPSRGGVADYTAHAVFASLTLRWP